MLSSTSYAGGSRIRNKNSRILTGSFDGLLRVWNASGVVTATSALCTSASCQSIYNATWISPSRIVSSGFGVPIRLWSYSEPGLEVDQNLTPNTTGTLSPQLDLYAHRGASNCLAIHKETSHILSAGDDGTLALFSTSTDPEEHGALPTFIKIGPPAPKKRRLSSTKQSSTPRAGPLSTTNPSSLSDSTSTRPLTGTIFHPHDPTFAYTTSRDRTLRTIDLTTTTTISTHTPQRDAALICLTALPSLKLLAAGTSSHSISLIDPRSDTRAATTEIARLIGFKNEVRAVHAAPSTLSTYQLAGASFDGTVRIFDVRDTRSALEANDDVVVGGARRIRQIYRIPRRSNEKCDRVVGGEGVKVFGMCWDEEVGIVSADEDGTGGSVQINKAG